MRHWGSAEWDRLSSLELREVDFGGSVRCLQNAVFFMNPAKVVSSFQKQADSPRKLRY